MILQAIDLSRAYSRTIGYRKVTPLLKLHFLSRRWSADVYMKCDQLQEIGAFKIRGAANFALQLTEAQLSRGLITHSSGNHAQAVAYMANKLGTKAHIVMPENSNKLKLENAEKWGAEITLCKATIEDRLIQANRIADETGGLIIPPFDHEWIVAGQATCAMEVFSQTTDVDIFVAPLGGGGLLAGSALAAEYFSAHTLVLGAEPEQAKDGYLGYKSGVREKNVKADTVADGLRTTVGEIPFSIIKESVADIWLADEADIVPWMYRIWEESKMIIEPSSAVPFAALDKQSHKIKGKKIVVAITGGNVDLTQLP
ncbi:MAG: threonine/serine dehydratase [Cryomorphaceae bacterium]